MDNECVNICRAINRIKGLRTTESCCGHGKDPFRVWFEVSDLKNLPVLLYYCAPCHVGFKWECKVKTDCSMSPAAFYIESLSVGEEAFKQAEVIAEKINRHLGQ